MFTPILTALILANPAAANYNSWVSPEIADTIQQCVISCEYREYLDYNGDGWLNIADVVAVRKRYQDNCRYGNIITINSETVHEITAENFTSDLIYWEIYSIDGQPCREYSLTVDKVTQVEIWIEFEDYAKSVTVLANPFTEVTEVV